MDCEGIIKQVIQYHRDHWYVFSKQVENKNNLHVIIMLEFDWLLIAINKVLEP